MRKFTDEELKGLLKFVEVLEGGKPQSASNLGYEISLYIESLVDELCTNDWYEGDYNGFDSEQYFNFESNIVDAIHLAEKLFGGTLDINSVSYITETLKVKKLTVEEILKIRDRNPWLNMDYAPDYQSE